MTTAPSVASLLSSTAVTGDRIAVANWCSWQTTLKSSMTAASMSLR